MSSSNEECKILWQNLIRFFKMQHEECSQILHLRNLIKFCKNITPQNLKPLIGRTYCCLWICEVKQCSSLFIQILHLRNLIKFCKIITPQNLKPHIWGIDSAFNQNSANEESDQILLDYHSTESEAS